MSIKQPKISIGADPELFAFKGTTPISVHNLLPGTKWNPMEIPRGAIQVDGVAAEFNIEPAGNSKDFVRNIKHVRRVMERILVAKDKEIKLHAVPTVMFTPEYFAELPDETKALGCEPDYNAYTKAANPKPETTKPMRTGSGHIHIGWEGCNPTAPDYVDTCCDLVKELDFILFRQSAKWDNDIERQELYGKPGAFRYKKYGLEYRVLSNKWLCDERIIKFIFDATRNITGRYLMGERFASQYTGVLHYEDYLTMRKLPIINEYLNEA